MLDRIRTAWRAFRDWCSAHWFEITGACITLLAAFGLARRRQKPAPVEPPSTDLVNAMREKREKDAEEKRAEAEAHRQFAEDKIREADAELERVRTMPAEDLLKESNERLRKLRKGGVLLALLAALSAPVAARAQGEVAEVPGPAGEPGWWLPDDFYRHVYGGFLEGERLKLEALPELRSALEACRAEADLRRDAVRIEREITDLATAKLAIANERLEQASRWFRSPRFLVPIGVVIGGLAVAGVVAVVTHD